MGLIELVVLVAAVVTLVTCVRSAPGPLPLRVLAWAASWAFLTLLFFGIQSLRDANGANDTGGIFLIVLSAMFLWLGSRLLREG